MISSYQTLTYTFRCGGTTWVVDHFSEDFIRVLSLSAAAPNVYVSVSLKDGRWDFESPHDARYRITMSMRMDDSVADDLLEFFNEHGPPEEKHCTCGSGGHPRKCAKHPKAFDTHCAYLGLLGHVEETPEAEEAIDTYEEALRAEYE